MQLRHSPGRSDEHIKRPAASRAQTLPSTWTSFTGGFTKAFALDDMDGSCTSTAANGSSKVLKTSRVRADTIATAPRSVPHNSSPSPRQATLVTFPNSVFILSHALSPLTLSIFASGRHLKIWTHSICADAASALNRENESAVGLVTRTNPVEQPSEQRKHSDRRRTKNRTGIEHKHDNVAMRINITDRQHTLHRVHRLCTSHSQ
jgi:hypothetical protein